jgi:hypothetical protein
VWLKHGDWNTRYYHGCANARRKSNFIREITDATRQSWKTSDIVEMAFVNYFVGLFKADQMGDMEPCLRYLPTGVLREMNVELLKEFTKDEVSVALFQMAPLKALDPDCFTVDFFQKNWTILGDEVCSAIIETLNSRVMPSTSNFTHIVLIPKSKSPSCIMEFRPISLCNVLYKLLLKVLANRLKKVLPFVISPTQKSFLISVKIFIF